MRTGRSFAGVMAVLLAVGATGRGLAQPVARPAGRAAGPVLRRSTGPEVGKRLDALLAGKRDLESVRLSVHWARRSASILRPEVGIWNRSRQFDPGREALMGVLKALREADFAAMPDSFGGIRRPPGGPAMGMPVRLVGSVSLTLGGVTKSSTQLGGGEQSEELRALAKRILDVWEQAARKGVEAADLLDGLRKVADGRLAPQTFRLTLVRVVRGRGAARVRCYFYLLDGAAEVRAVEGGSTKHRRLALSPKALRDILDVLVAEGVDGLPRNLWAPHYTDLSVSVLNRHMGLQARPDFARIGPRTHGEKQERFNRIFAALDALRARVLKEGKAP